MITVTLKVKPDLLYEQNERFRLYVDNYARENHVPISFALYSLNVGREAGRIINEDYADGKGQDIGVTVSAPVKIPVPLREGTTAQEVERALFMRPSEGDEEECDDRK